MVKLKFSKTLPIEHAIPENIASQIVYLTGIMPPGLRFKNGIFYGKILPETLAGLYKLKAHSLEREILDIEIHVYEYTKSYTHQNHLQYGYGEYLAPWTLERPTFFKRIFGKPERSTIGTMAEEGIRAARLIGEKAKGQKIGLFMSGGIDGDTTAFCFKEAGVDFQPITLRYDVKGHYINDFDFKYVEPVCEQRGYRKPKYYDVDIIGLYQNENNWLPYVEECGAHRPEFAIFLSALDRVINDGFFPVLSGITPLYFHHEIRNPDGTFYMPPWIMHDGFYSYHKLFDKRGADGVAHFMYYTPEFFYSQLQSPYMRNLVQNNQQTLYKQRVELYQSGGMKIEGKPNKYYGFEELYQSYFYVTGKNFLHPLRGPVYETDLRWIKSYDQIGIKNVIQYDLQGVSKNGNLDVDYLLSQQVEKPGPALNLVELELRATQIQQAPRGGFTAEALREVGIHPDVEKAGFKMSNASI